MKKLYIALLTTFTCGMAYALPLGNPAEASLFSQQCLWQNNECNNYCSPCVRAWDHISLRVGFYGDYVFQRHLEVNARNNHSSIENSSLYTNAGYLALNFYEYLDIFSTLGTSRFCFDTSQKSFIPTASDLNLTFNTVQHFSWSLGARATLLQYKCTTIGMEGQYFSTQPNSGKFIANVTFLTYPSHFNMSYNEWQLGIGITQRFALFAPYIGIKWSKVKIEFNRPTIEGFGIPLFDLTNRNRLAFAVGVSLLDCHKVLLTAEGRYGDEKAAYVNGQWRF